MGAAMTVAIVPSCQYSADRHIALAWKLHDMEMPCDSFYVEMYSVEEYREALQSALDRYWTFSDRADVGYIYPIDLPFCVTGGMTHGDDPTDSFESMALLSEMIWDELLEYAKQDWNMISAEETAKIRAKAEEGHWELVIPHDAPVEKVDDGYWVEARVWVDAD